MRLVAWLLPAFTAVLPGCSAERVPVVPERPLGVVEKRFDQPFTHIVGIRELSDGRVMVADPEEKKVVLLDAGWTAAEPVARQGQGPTEYSYPAALLAYPGDTTLISDLFQRRLLLVDPMGAPVRVIPLPQSLGFGLELKSDGLGNLYLRSNPLPGSGGLERGVPDSAPVVRWNLGSNVVDTIENIGLPKMEGGGGGGGFVFMIQPMAPADDWSVTPEGWVGIARVAPFAVDWFSGDHAYRGAELGYEPILVTEADKAEWQRSMREGAGSRAISIPLGGGGGGIADAPPPSDGPPPDMPELKWPTHKPPFLEGAVIASPARQLWILRTRPAGDAVPRYDVIDSTGSLIERVSVPAGSRIVGLGRSMVYLVRTDEDGLQWLERYRQ